MRTRTFTLLFVLALALPQAAFGSADAVIKDCSDNGKLDKKYSKSDLKKAKSSLPSDINEYTDCGSVINRAISSSGGGGKGNGHGSGPSAGASGSGGSGSAAPASSGGGGSPHSGAPTAKVKPPKATGAKPTVPVAGQSVTPGENGLFKASNSANELPLPILLALIGIAALTAAGGALVISRRGGFRAALRLLRR